MEDNISGVGKKKKKTGEEKAQPEALKRQSH